MDLSPTLLIVIGIVCVFLGYVASVLINTLRDETEPAGTLDEAPPGGKRGRYIPVTRLWREKQAGGLVVEINGKSFVAATPLSDAERSDLEQAARDLRAWLGMGLANPAVYPAPAPAAAGTPAPAGTPVPAGTSGLAASLSPANPAAIPLPLVPPAPAKARSIVMQIDDILQDMLAGSPLVARGIKLMEDPARGVIVYIGLDHYDGIDAVPDPEIKAVIRRAVQEWESTQ